MKIALMFLRAAHLMQLAPSAMGSLLGTQWLRVGLGWPVLYRFTCRGVPFALGPFPLGPQLEVLERPEPNGSH